MPPQLAQVSLIRWIGPGVLVAVLLAGGLYEMAIGPWRPRFSAARPIRRRQRIWFWGAMLSIYLGFGGPLDVLADHYLFAAHMLQHTLETMVAAPLILLALPDWLVRPVWNWKPTHAVMCFLSRPVLAILDFALVLALNLWPPIYNLIETNGAVHFLDHSVLLITALAMWWPVLAPLPERRLHPGLQLLYLFLDGMPMLVSMTIVMFAPHNLYRIYRHAPRLFGLTPLASQQLGTALMITIMHIAYGIAFIAAFSQWVRTERGPAIDPPIVVVRPSEERPSPSRHLG